MLNVGLRYSFREVLGPLRDVKSVALVLLANFVAAPAFAWALGTILQLSDEHMAGLLVVGTAAGAARTAVVARAAGVGDACATAATTPPRGTAAAGAAVPIATEGVELKTFIPAGDAEGSRCAWA